MSADFHPMFILFLPNVLFFEKPSAVKTLFHIPSFFIIAHTDRIS
jgi:hypothetical protein